MNQLLTASNVIRQAAALLMVTLVSSTGQAQSAQEIAKKVLPSTVLIVAHQRSGKTVALGSGFFIQPRIIATNHHVIKGSSKLYFKLFGQRDIRPIDRVLAVDVSRDLALLQVSNVGAEPLTLGDSDSVEVGERVYAVGNPEGLEGTISEGIVSGIRQGGSKRYIQITAPISPGSSGGPILNTSGEVIGIVVSTIRKGQNLNFAVPVSYLAQITVNMQQVWTATSQGRGTKWDDLVFVEEGSGKNERYKPYTNPEIERSITDRQRQVREHPNSPDAHFRLAETYREHNRKPESIQAYNQAIRLRPDFVEAYYGLARSYMMHLFSALVDKEESRTQALKAVEAYKHAIRIKPDYVDAHVGIGNAYSDLERYDEAIDAFRVALRINPKSGDAYEGLGWTFEYLGRPVDAVAAFQQAVLIEPYSGLMLEHVAELLSSIARIDEAIGYANKAIRTPTAALSFGTGFRVLAEIYTNSGHVSKGIANFDKFIVEIKRELDSGLVEDGSHEKAELLAKLDYAYCYKGFLFVAAGDKTSALEQYRILKSLGGGLPDSLANDLFNAIYK